MAYVNNGTERSLKVKVYKKVGGNYAQGYPKTYDGQEAFPGYAALTDTQVRQLSDADFTTRYNAFVSYVESIEGGLDFDTDVVGDGATRAGASCLTPATTTTTSTTTTTKAVESVNVDWGTESSIRVSGVVSDYQNEIVMATIPSGVTAKPKINVGFTTTDESNTTAIVYYRLNSDAWTILAEYDTELSGTETLTVPEWAGPEDTVDIRLHLRTSNTSITATLFAEISAVQFSPSGRATAVIDATNDTFSIDT